MKIAMLGQKRIPSREGGVEIVVEELSTRMVKSGHEVTCYNRGGKHALDKNVETSNEKEYKGVKLSKCFTIDKKGLAAMTSSFFATIKAIFSKNEVIHYHAEGPCAWMWLVKWFTNKKIVATIHGLDWQRAKWGGFATQYIKFGEKCAVKYADEIIVLSKNVQQYFKDTYNRETVFIPNGVNKPEIVKADIIEKEYNLKKDDYILFLGRIVPEKGIHYLIDAYNEAKVDKKLVIAGGASDTDTYYSELKEKAKGNENIIFTGFVQGQTLEELYSNAYIYCLPSDLEGMPLSLLEGMSYKNCCLTSDIKECSEVVEDKAVTFKKSNVKDLTKKLQHLCDNKKDVQRYKNNAQDYILEKYNWNDVVDKTLNLYDSKKTDNKKDNNKKNLSFYIMMICFYLCLFNNPLQRFIPFVKYTDEILAMLFIPYAIYKYLVKKEKMLDKNDTTILLLLIIIVIIGLLSNIIFEYQSLSAIIPDAIAICKFFFIYFLFKSMNIKKVVVDNKETIIKNIRIITKYGIFLTILNYLYVLFPCDFRYGLLSNKLIFSHVTFLAATASFMILLYIYLEKRPDFKTIVGLLFMIVSTLRSKAIAFALIMVVMYFYLNYTKKKINVKSLAIIGLIALVVALPKFYFYFVEIDNSARNMLVQKSFVIANDHFPLGSGFGTFGSHYSGVEYSPIYSKYDLDHIYGLTQNDPAFVSDSFWPMILGQFGYIGTILYLVIIFNLFANTQKIFSKDKVNIYIAGLGVFTYLMISSIAESAFVNPISLPFAILLGLCFSKEPNIDITKEQN